MQIFLRIVRRLGLFSIKKIENPHKIAGNRRRKNTAGIYPLKTKQKATGGKQPNKGNGYGEDTKKEEKEQSKMIFSFPPFFREAR